MNLRSFYNKNANVINIFLYLIAVTLFYLFFLNNIFNPKFNFWNSDAEIKMFPSRVYIHERLSNGEFPFWTERVFLGYPLYYDIELGILNPINILSILFLGPVLSLKILHFLTYLAGCYAFYKLSFKYSDKNKFLLSLVSSISFYFTFFHINHLIHMNMVLVSMLLPLQIYVLDKFLETKYKKYVVFQILLITYGILWGQPQITIYILFVLLFFFYFQTKNIKYLLKYFFVTVFFSFLITLPQLYPSFSVFFNSERNNTESLRYIDFSNTATVSLTNIFPYLLGYYQNFQGYEISGAVSFVEVYNYIGISITTLLIFYLLFGRKDRFYNFSLTLIYFYFIFTFLGGLVPFDIPFYSEFRYWTRGIFFIPFLTFFALRFFLNQECRKNELEIRPLIFISLFLILSFLIEDKEFINFLIQNQFVYVKKIEFVIWITILFLTSILFFLLVNKKIKKSYFAIFLGFLIVFDLKYYSSDMIPLRISRYVSEKSYITDPGCINQRCLLENSEYDGYKFLLFKTFSPFGYSQFIDGEYANYFYENIFSNLEESQRSEQVRSDLDLHYLGNIGFKKILLADKKNYTLSSPNLWVFREEMEGNFNYFKEGDFEITVSAPTSKRYLLNLKYSRNFDVYVNGQKQELVKNGIFSEIYLSEGVNRIRFVYLPYDVLYPLIFSIIAIFLCVLVVIKLKWWDRMDSNH